jgi:hypothetical protein
MVDKKTGQPYLRISLRGQRPVGNATAVRFKYLLTGSKAMTIVLANTQAGERSQLLVEGLTTGEWEEKTILMYSGSRDRVQDKNIDRTRMLTAADELRFVLPKGAELLVDDVLVYEPATAK